MNPLRQKMIDWMILKGYANATQKSYLYHVSLLARFYHQSPERLTEDEVQSYLLHCYKDKHWAFSTCRQFIHAANCFFSHVAKKPLSTTTLPFPATEQKIPELLNRTEVRRLIAACTNKKYQPALKLVYATGVRLSELVKLKVQDLDGESNTIRIVNAKGHKDRLIEFPEGLKKCLRTYWHYYHPLNWLFYSRHREQPLSRSTIYCAFKKAKKAVGIKKVGGVHQLRHAYASHELEAGMPLPRLQQQLGHSDIRTTLRYTRWVKNIKGADSFDLLSTLEQDES